MEMVELLSLKEYPVTLIHSFFPGNTQFYYPWNQKINKINLLVCKISLLNLTFDD